MEAGAVTTPRLSSMLLLALLRRPIRSYSKWSALHFMRHHAPSTEARRLCRRAVLGGASVPFFKNEPTLVTARKPPLSRGICDEPPHVRRGLGHATHRTGTTERRLASNRPAFPTSGHRRPFPSRCAERGGRSPQEMAALRQRGVFDVVRPHACAVAQADRCGAGWRPVSTMQRCVQTHRRRGSAPGRDRDAQGC